MNMNNVVITSKGDVGYSSGIEIFIDGIQLKCVQSIDIPIHLNEFIPIIVKFVPAHIDWITIPPKEHIDNKTKGRFKNGAWVWDE